MTFRECAIVEAYTGYSMLSHDKMEYMYDYLEELLGRPILPNELGNKRMIDIIHGKSKPDFINLCITATEN